ncbi:Magnesium transporter [Nymphaea thermarum]|nr:Magnesium transporter [Nymphaea thermarum]
MDRVGDSGGGSGERNGREESLVVADSQGGFKKKAAASRSWIVMDCTGEGTILDVDKYAIMHRVQIHARDLRILDPLLSYPSTILGRERAIVLNLEHIKAIITSEEVLLRDPLDDNVIPVVEELRRRLPPGNIVQPNGEGREHVNGQHDMDAGEEDEPPFEFRALEISSRNLDRVRKLKSAMTRLTGRVQKVRDELEQLLDDDDDMADLYLTRKSAGATSPISGSGAPNWFPASPTIASKISRASRATVHGNENDIEELEMLLELREYIDDTEDYINIQLDNHRNQLIQLELFLSSGTVCLSIYSLVAGIFGMNIPYTWNDDHGYVFKWVVILSGVGCLLLFSLIVSYARYKGLVGS